MRVRVYRDRCIGAGNCVGIAPKVFTLGFDRKAEVTDAGGADPADLRDAAEACPTNAIFLFDDDGKQLYPES
jgi:ferredoxin